MYALLFSLNRSSYLSWALSTETLPAGMCWWGRTRCWRSLILVWLERMISMSRPQMGNSLFVGWPLSPLWTECSQPRVMCEWLMHSSCALDTHNMEVMRSARCAYALIKRSCREVPSNLPSGMVCIYCLSKRGCGITLSSTSNLNYIHCFHSRIPLTVSSLSSGGHLASFCGK